MIRNAKYRRIKLLKSFSTNWEGLSGRAALEVEKELQKERWDTAKGRFCVPGGEYVLSRPAGSWLLLELGSYCMILEGVVRVKMYVGHLSAALPRIILRSRLLTHTPPRWVKDTFPYLRIPLIMLSDLTLGENVEECIF